MNVIGVITEFNPFHNGHKYYIDKIKEMYPDSILICVTSSSFSQRGELSILNKWEKTEISLNSKIDLVIELPYLFTVQSADVFAHASLQLLNEFKIDTLIFGSESNDVELLKKYANKNNYEDKLPPNDILGISYIKEIVKNKYNINPITIQRTNDYHDIDSISSIVSASNIREKFYSNKDIKKYIPNITYKYLKNKKIDNNKYLDLIKYKTINTNLTNYLDVNDELSNKLKNNIFNSNNIDLLIKEIKTKRYNYSKISRMLNHILIGLNKKDASNIKDIEYIRILGFNNIGKQYLHSIKKNINYLIIYNYNKKYITSNYELNASKIYSIITNDNILDKEYKKTIIIK